MNVKIIRKVVRGKGKGKQLGFPTVNIEIGDKDLESGVYAGKVITREYGANKKRMGANTDEWLAGIFVGENKKILEAHLIDFSGDLYGREIVIEIGGKIREVKKFSSDEELKKQIKKDIKCILANGS